MSVRGHDAAAVLACDREPIEAGVWSADSSAREGLEDRCRTTVGYVAGMVGQDNRIEAEEPGIRDVRCCGVLLGRVPGLLLDGCEAAGYSCSPTLPVVAEEVDHIRIQTWLVRLFSDDCCCLKVVCNVQRRRTRDVACRFSTNLGQSTGRPAQMGECKRRKK